jgi:hypothetical protein
MEDRQMTDYDLRAACREALSEGGGESFREYAERVVDAMPRTAYRDALLRTLPDYIRDLDRRDAGPVVPPAPVPVKGEHASRRVAAVARAWHRLICRQIITPEGITKPLGDATREEVIFYADMLRAKGREILETADGFDRIADLMRKRKAERVRDLPPHLGSAAVQKAA